MAARNNRGMSFVSSLADEALLDELPVLVWTADDKGSVIHHSEALLRFLGTPASASSPGWFGHVHSDDQVAVTNAWTAAIEMGTSFSCEVRVRCSDGTYRWCAARANARRASSSSLGRWVGVLVDIHDRIVHERGRGEESETFYAAVEAMPTPVGVYKAVRGADGAIVDFRVVYVNEAACQANRMSRESQVGRLLNDILPGHRHSTLFVDYCQLVETGRSLTSTSVVYTDTYGSTKEETRVFRIDADRVHDGFVAVWRDVTDEHHREAQFQQQSALLSAVVESSPVAIFAKDLDGRYTLANSAMAHIFSARPDDIVGRTDRELFGPVVADVFEESDRSALEDGVTITREETIVGADGHQAVFLVAKKSVGSADSVSGVCGVAVDITQRVRAQSQLEVAEARLLLALRAGQLGVWEWNLEDNAIRWSPEAFAILGLQPDSECRVLQDFLTLVHPDDRDAMWREVEAALNTGSEFEAEFRIIGKAELKWVKNRGLVRRDTVGRATGLIGIVQDISGSKAHEQELQRSQAQMRARAEELQLLLDAAPAAIWISHDSDGHTITGSRFAAELLRMRPGDNLSKSAGEDAPRHFTIRSAGRELSPEELPVQRASRGEEIRDFEEEIVFEDGATVTLFGTALPLKDATGTARGAISAFVDVTALKQAEAEIRQAKSVAEAANRLKDQFLATLSHELRTPLNAIVGYVSMLRGDVIAADRRDNALAIIERNARTQLRLVEELLDISRITAGTLRLSLERVSLSELVGAAIDAVHPAAADKQIALRVKIDENVPDVVGDRIRLQQVLWNLLNNAIKFTSRAGEVDIRLSCLAAGVSIIVCDDGDGIAPDFIADVFEPFRQDNRHAGGVQSGLGLGLTITKHLVELHGGTIGVESEGIGKGAAFSIRLPAATS